MADISKIKLPDNSVKDIKDSTAREQANWNTNNGVKNLLDVTYDTYTNNECSYVKNADGSITLTISSTVAANRQLNLTDKIDNIYDGMIINGSPTGYSTGNIEYLVTGLKADGTYQNEQFSYNGAESTINRGTPKIQFAIYVKSGVTARTVTFYPMVREVGDSTYQPYALPNTKITPELIELVDSGAKNLSPVSTGTSSVASYIVESAANLPAGDYVFCWKNSVSSGVSTVINCYTSDNTRVVNENETNSAVETRFITIPQDCVKFNLYTTGANQVTDLMICTKAAWDVSQKFVPYAPTNAELYAMIQALQS